MNALSRRLAAPALLMLVLTTIGVGNPGPGVAQEVPSDAYARLSFRHIGPVGNRFSAVAGVAGDPTIYYAGAASGGVFKTTDAGHRWEPIFDGPPVASIGALAVAPSDPEVVWAGTGESWIRSHISVGAGIYKSTDGGETWELMGLEDSGRIARIVIDPRNPDVVFVAALGHGYGPQQQRGVFRTSDGGETWQRVLFVDQHTGASDVVMSPDNPRILLAGTWEFVIHTWGRTSGGPGSGIFRSEDGGDTWERLEGNGLPEQPELGRIGLAFAPSDGDRVYAIIETGQGKMWKGERTSTGTLWRSDDGADSWEMVSSDRNVSGRPHYYSRMAVAPDDPDEAYFLTASFSTTLDGGETLERARGYPETAGGHNLGSPPQGDFHDMWIDPTNPDRMIVANDGGVGISVNRGETWDRVQLPNAQIYHVTTDDQIPYDVYGNRQDGPSVRGPSNSLVYGYGHMVDKISRGLWREVGGGESGWTIPDPDDPHIIWSSGTNAGSLGGSIDRYDARNHQFRRVEIWPESPIGHTAAQVKYRFHWTFPVEMSPHDPKRVYAGSQFVHLTTNGGHSWDVISPDLTRADTSRMGFSGGLTGDNIGVEYAGAILALAESPLQDGLIWAGTNDGLVQVTRDGGETWTNVTSNIPDLPEWGTIYDIEPSPHAAGTAYIVVDRHQEGDFDPYVYRTDDYGASWEDLSATVPRSHLSYAHSIEEDPVRPGLLFLGTENALYVSFDDGSRWLPLQNNLPHVPVYGITVQEHFSDLVLATYGRGFWILDDITPLRELGPDMLSSDLHLFAPRPAYRFRGVTPPAAPAYDPVAGDNPPYGASINYYLGSVAEEGVDIEILDADGQLVRKLEGPGESGIHRIWWDLEYEAASSIRLWMPPINAPWFEVGPDGREIGSNMTMLAPPGTYTIRVMAHDQTVSQSLTVRKDPNSTGSLEDIRETLDLQWAIRDDYERLATMINEIELVRKQLSDLRLILKGEDAAPVVTAATSLDDRLVAIEKELHQMRLAGGQDSMRWPAKLLGKLTRLFRGLIGDFPPTTQHRAVHEELRGELQELESRYRTLVNEGVAGFNEMLDAEDIPRVVVPST